MTGTSTLPNGMDAPVTTTEHPTTDTNTPRAMTLMCDNDQYRYQITRQKHTDGRYGVCEICGEPALVAHYQVEQHRYSHPDGISNGWTVQDCSDCFGHVDCLSSVRRFTTDNQEIQTGMTVQTTCVARHTVIQFGTLLAMDAALIREVNPRQFGHKPYESWLPLQDLRIVR